MMRTIMKEQIDALFASAEHQGDYIIGLYKLAYGNDWARVKMVEEWPMISTEANEYIFGLAIAFDQKHHPDVMAGGAWMNNGFSGYANVEGWEVQLRKTEWLPDAEGQPMV